MAGSITINPMATTNAAGLFNTNSQGYTQGDVQDDPAAKFFLSGGLLIASALTPLWGGLPITEIITIEGALGNTVQQATTLANTTGICVFNQAYQGITTPQSNVPLYAPGMSVAFYRFGTGARIPVRLNPALVTLAGEFVNQQVSWDYTNNWLTTYSVSAFPCSILDVSITGNKTVSYNSGTGNANWLTTEYIALISI